jgi:Na+-driven multidrug efflux pump
MLACVAASALMVAAGLVFYVAATPLASFFLGGREGEVIPLAARLLRIVAYAMLPLAVSMVLAGALRGAGDTRWPLAFTVIGLLLIRVPLALWLAPPELSIFGTEFHGAGLGAAGAWYAAVIDIYVRGILMAARFLHGGWQRIEV